MPKPSSVPSKPAGRSNNQKRVYNPNQMGSGQDAFAHLIRGISIGKLKTYQIYEGFKVRAHLQKVNTETLRKAVPRLWERISSRDEEFARDLAQAILVSHLEMITAVLDFTGV